MNTDTLNFALLAFVSLFTMVNPLGAVPVYLSMTTMLDSQQRRQVAWRA
jgi:multiple antibiotic resistance protein